VRPSGHSTLRIITFDPDAVAEVRADLRKLGCATELSHIPTLIAVDIPPEVRYESVIQYLDNKQSMGTLDDEEAAVRHRE
jgi:hypothetical protein